MNSDAVRQAVRAHYAGVARQGSGCGCGAKQTSCCGPASPRDTSAQLGYSETELDAGDGANLGLGCGNPQAIAALQPGETVLDLGSGAGFDAFLAARRVGETGFVIGVDMTPDMLSKARANAAEGGYTNVEFRLGEIEALPVADATVNVIISNCVINLSPEKARVFREAFRVLVPGGRLAISDVVALTELPAQIADDIALLCGCVSGAMHRDALAALLTEVGFVDVRVEINETSRALIKSWAPGSGIEQYVASASITAVKP
jgi:SAM-dependent methyltransferase